MDNSSDDNGSADHEFVSAHCRVLKFTDLKGNTKEMYLPKSLDLERPKRSRTNFTIRQLKELEKAFHKNQYLVGKERKSLSERLELSEAQIKIWYQNRRTKHKKEKHKERERMTANAESIAANNIMNLLQKQHFQRHHSHHSPPILQLSSADVITPKAYVSPIESQSLYSGNSDLMLQNHINCQWNSNDYLNPIYLSQNFLHK